MNVNIILNASNIQDLKSLGPYLDIKKSFEDEIDSKLGISGWASFFDKINSLKEVISSNKIYLASICDENSFQESKNKTSKLLNIKVKAKSRNDLKRKIERFITLFCSNIFNPYDYYEKTKLEKFRNSSKLEGIEIQVPNKTARLENVLAKYQR